MTKTTLHPRNSHNSGYDFNRLVAVYPPLSTYIIKNKYNQKDTIEFSNADAVKSLNTALLMKDYNIKHWNIPAGFLCPPIPGRADYIHYLADLLDNTRFDTSTSDKDISNNSSSKRSLSENIKVLDIGTGASCIYPIIGQRVYHWNFVASDIDPIAIKAAQLNIEANKPLASHIECRLQLESKNIFKSIIKENEFYHLTLCNPPFHKSLEDANTGTTRKLKNLAKNRQEFSKLKENTTQVPALNFGGQKAELWCDGGELAFIRRMINESKIYAKQVLWFTCLVSKKDNLSAIKLSLKKAKVNEIKVVDMAQGQKISRFIAWRF